MYVFFYAATLIFLSSLLLMSFLIPVSLNVSMEVIKAFYGLFLELDVKFMNAQREEGCQVSNTSMIEELGSIDYVLTDKTGTLTCN